jgi:hypothetical protein
MVKDAKYFKIRISTKEHLFKATNKAKIKLLNGIITSLFFINMLEDLGRDGLMESLLFLFIKEKQYKLFILNS